MRDVSESLLRCQTLCWVWRLTLKDDSQLGFTDHDQSLTFEGLICDPGSGLNAGNDQSVEGVLDGELISPDDIRVGRFDNAKIERFRVNWAATNEFVAMATGYLGEITQTGNSFEAQFRGEASRLERSTGRVFARVCDASFGDARCAVDKGAYPEGTVCPRTFSACQNQFSNTLNFRGFPYILGDDVLTAGVKEGEIRDGGSRFS